MTAATILIIWTAASFPAGLLVGRWMALCSASNTRFTTPGEAKALAVADSSTPRVSAAAGVTLFDHIHAAEVGHV